MRICCPKCLTLYLINEWSNQLLGQRLRCSKCGNTWQYAPIIQKKSINAAQAEILAPVKQDIFHRQQINNYPQLLGNNSVDNHFKQKSLSETDSEKFAATQQAPTSTSQLKTKSKTSISQCVFCKRSSKCNMHDLYSGRLH